MAMNADNVAVVRPVVNGAVWTAAAKTAVPTSASEELGDTFGSLGWISEDGITMSINKESEDIKGFGGDTVVTIQTSHDVEFTFKPMEWNANVLTEMFGTDNVTADTMAKITSDELPERVYVFDLRGRNGEKIRYVIPNCKITEIGELAIKHSEPMAAELTIKAFPDSNGVKVYIYKAVA